MRRSRERREEQAGFTLIELLLTIFILSVVMLPLLMWAGLAFTAGGDTGVSDRTVELTTLNQMMSRDVSGALLSDTVSGKVLPAYAAGYASCNLPASAKVLLEGSRATDLGNRVVYYLAGTGADRQLFRLTCNAFSDPAPTGVDIKADTTVMASKFQTDPTVNYTRSEVRLSVDVTGLDPLTMRFARNTGVTTDSKGAVLVPIIDCSPSCSVFRRGSVTQGSADPNALTATVQLSGKYSASVDTSLPITHYRWTYGDEAAGSPPGNPVAVTTPGTIPDLSAHVYDCKSVTSPTSPHWLPATKSCHFTATLQVWSTSGSVALDTPTATATQEIEVRNNAPKVTVTPVSVDVPAFSTVSFDATNTIDVDGVASSLSFAWDFGDPASMANNSATTRAATHKYALRAGTVTEATLTVTDDDAEVTVVKIPITIGAAQPTLTVTATCAAGTGDVCLRNTVPMAVHFDVVATVQDTSSELARYHWVIARDPNQLVNWTPTTSGQKLQLSTSYEQVFPNGETIVQFSVQTGDYNRDGTPVQADYYWKISIHVKPTAVVTVAPAKAITPDNGQTSFFLDGTDSIEGNGKPMAGYLWTATPNKVGAPTLTSTDPKPTFTPPVGWYGKYSLTLTVTNYFGIQDTLAPPITLKVNQPPTFKVANVAALNASVNTPCSGDITDFCVYRGNAYQFKLYEGAVGDPDNPYDPDGDAPITITAVWDFTTASGATFSTPGSVGTPPASFWVLGEKVDAKVTVSDGDGGYTVKTFSFRVQNQAPTARITAVTPKTISPVPAKFNLFADFTSTDRGLQTVTSSTSSDNDTLDVLKTCEWKIDGAAVAGPGANGCGDLSIDWFARNHTLGDHTVELRVRDQDDAWSTWKPFIVTLRARPTATLTVPVGSNTTNASSITVVFTVGGTESPGGAPGSLTYFANWGDDCNAQGLNCKISAVTPVNGTIAHTYTKASCSTAVPKLVPNSPGQACGLWLASIWSETSWPHGITNYTNDPGSPPPNGWSQPTAQITVRANIKPRVVFGPNGDASDTTVSGVQSPVGPDGSSFVNPDSGNSAASVPCSVVGATCTYTADGSQSWDPDGAANGLGPCKGINLVSGNPCLKYAWTLVSGSGVGNIPPASITLTGANTPKPVATMTTPALSGVNAPYFVMVLTITDSNGTGASESRFLRVVLQPPPVVSNICATRPLTAIKRGVPTLLDGGAWGAAGSTSCSQVTQATHWGGYGMYNAPFYQGTLDENLNVIDMGVDLVAKIGAAPAQIVRSASNVKTDFTKLGFIVGSTVQVIRGAPFYQGNAVIASVTPSTITFADPGPTGAFPTAAGVTDLKIITACAGINCIPSANYHWTFSDPAHPGADCNRTADGKAAAPLFTTFCDAAGVVAPASGVTLTVTDETGVTSDPSPPAPFKILDAPPVPSFTTFDTSLMTTSTKAVVGNPQAIQFDARASYDPDGGPGGTTPSDWTTLTNFSWTVQNCGNLACTTGAVTAFGGNSATPTYNFTANNSNGYKVTLMVTDALGNTSTAPGTSVTVYIYPKPSVSIGSSASGVCQAGAAATCTLVNQTAGKWTLPFTSTITPAPSGTDTYLWTFGDVGSTVTNPNTSASPNPSHDFVGPNGNGYGTYNVTLVYTDLNGVKVTATATVTVDQPPSLTVSATYTDPGKTPCDHGAGTTDCSVNTGGSSALLELTAAAPLSPSQQAAGATVKYGWNFGGTADPSVLPVVQHTFTADTVVTVTATVYLGATPGAVSTTTFRVKMNPLPTAIVTQGGSPVPTSGWTLPRNTDIVDVSGATSTDTPVGTPNNGIIAWHWEFTSADDANCNKSFDGIAPTIKLDPVGVCTGYLVLTVTDVDQGKGSTTLPGIPFTVLPAKPTVVITTNKAPSNIGSLAPGQTSAAVIDLISTSTQSGYTPARSTISNERWVIVPNLLPNNAGNDATEAANAANCLASGGADPTPAANCWTFRTPVGQKALFQPVLSAGVYTAYLYVDTSNGQSNSGHLDFEVNAPPVPSFVGTVPVGTKGTCTAPGAPVVCKVYDNSFDPNTFGPYNLTFTDTSTKGAQTASSFTRRWTIVNLATNATTVYPPIGQPASSATVYNPPTSPANPSPFTGYGDYSVTMVVTDSLGASSTATGLVSVYPRPTVTISGTTAPGGVACASTHPTSYDCVVNLPVKTDPGTLNFTANASSAAGITGYQWSFGGGTPAPAVTDGATPPAHTYTGYGLRTVQVIVTDGNGATALGTFRVKLNAPPTPHFKVGAAVDPARVVLQRSTDLAGFTGINSTDDDGTVTSWSYDFADNRGAGTQPSRCNLHIDSTVAVPSPLPKLSPTQVPVPQTPAPNLIACEGKLSMTVTDDDGNTATLAVPRDFEVDNVAPVALMSASGETRGASPFSPTFIPIDGNGVASNDPDTKTVALPRGDIASYTWTVTDDQNGDQVVAGPTTLGFAEYTGLVGSPLTAKGIYTVTLTVTDTHGTPTTTSMKVEVVTPPNPIITVNGQRLDQQPPYISVPPGLTTFDGSLTTRSSANTPLSALLFEVCEPTTTLPVACDPTPGKFHQTVAATPADPTGKFVFPNAPGTSASFIVRLTVEDQDFVRATSAWMQLKVTSP
ncbi:MAG: PKD domain-containing protein [Acidimicrobiales bacterium]